MTQNFEPTSSCPHPLSTHATSYEEREGGVPIAHVADWYAKVVLPRRAARALPDDLKASVIAAEIAIFGHQRTFP